MFFSRLRRRRRSCALAFGLLLVGGRHGIAEAFSGAMIHAGDKVQVTVYNHPDISQIVTVDASERITLPLAGSVETQGADPDILERRIAARLAPYIVKVAVDVQVIAADPSIFVSGGPIGILTFTPGETLSQAIAQIQSRSQQRSSQRSGEELGAAPSDGGAQSISHSRLDFRHVNVTRDGRLLGPFDVVAYGDSGESGPVLKPGDRIVLRNKTIRVRVDGSVADPGSAYLDSDEPLRNALSQTGGISQDGAAYVLLTRDGRLQRFPLGAAALAEPAHLGDVVDVPRAPKIGVVGAVDKPGDVNLRGDASLISAIYNAGGPAKNANLKSVAVVHDGVRTEYDLLAAVHGGKGNPMLVDGDTVFVPVGHRMDFTAFWQAVASLGPLIYAIK